jgi:hypothetical protein
MLTFDHSLYIAWGRFAGVSNEREPRVDCNAVGGRHTTSSILGRSFVVDSSPPKIETRVRRWDYGRSPSATTEPLAHYSLSRYSPGTSS